MLRQFHSRPTILRRQKCCDITKAFRVLPFTLNWTESLPWTKKFSNEAKYMPKMIQTNYCWEVFQKKQSKAFHFSSCRRHSKVFVEAANGLSIFILSRENIIARRNKGFMDEVGHKQSGSRDPGSTTAGTAATIPVSMMVITKYFETWECWMCFSYSFIALHCVVSRS